MNGPANQGHTFLPQWPAAQVPALLNCLPECCSSTSLSASCPISCPHGEHVGMQDLAQVCLPPCRPPLPGLKGPPLPYCPPVPHGLVSWHLGPTFLYPFVCRTFSCAGLWPWWGKTLFLFMFVSPVPSTEPSVFNWLYTIGNSLHRHNK